MNRVLAIDDEEPITDLIKMQLEAYGGFNVRTENDPELAMKTAHEFMPDVILLDIMMPKIDGSELAAQFLNDAKLKNVPIIFLTALVSVQEMKEGSFLPGARTYIPKPIDWTELMKTIQNALHPQVAIN